ncbi:MAG: heavy metal-binding domain-containing protein [Bacteroidota bacterium]
MKTTTLTIALALIVSGTMVFAQSNTKLNEQKSTKTEMQKDSVYYTCSMHPDVKMTEAGKCSKCGMNLEKKILKVKETKSEKKEAMKTYTCSMHPEVKSDKPGSCPKCGMNLIETKSK